MSDKLTVGKNAKGFALFSRQNIRKNKKLIVFGGHILTVREYHMLPKNLFDIPIQIDNNFLFGPTNSSEMEDTEYLNHSCDPNCGFD